MGYQHVILMGKGPDGKPAPVAVDADGNLMTSSASGGGTSSATLDEQQAQTTKLAEIADTAAAELAELYGLAKETTLQAILAANSDGNATRESILAKLEELAQEASAQSILTKLTEHGITLDAILDDADGILTGIGLLATSDDVAAVEAATLADDANIATIATTIAAQATAAKQDAAKAVLDTMDTSLNEIEADIDAMRTALEDVDTNTDGLETLIGTTNTKLNGGLPAALGAGGGLKIEGVGTAGTPAGGVVSIQGVTNGLPLVLSTSYNLWTTLFSPPGSALPFLQMGIYGYDTSNARSVECKIVDPLAATAGLVVRGIPLRKTTAKTAAGTPAASLIVRAGACWLYKVDVTNTTGNASYVTVVDATSAPTNGTSASSRKVSGRPIAASVLGTHGRYNESFDGLYFPTGCTIIVENNPDATNIDTTGAPALIINATFVPAT